MKKVYKISFLLTLLSLCFLSACNIEARDALNEKKEVDFEPVRYDPNLDTNINESNNDYKIRYRELQTKHPEELID
ncbi:MAG: hypothetical protein K0Q87_1223 [Neobacillus sp.]|jgi:hypothetical protein|nr:hypothetical protein [Neobacillus sp.]